MNEKGRVGTAVSIGSCCGAIATVDSNKDSDLFFGKMSSLRSNSIEEKPLKVTTNL